MRQIVLLEDAKTKQSHRPEPSTTIDEMSNVFETFEGSNEVNKRNQISSADPVDGVESADEVINNFIDNIEYSESDDDEGMEFLDDGGKIYFSSDDEFDDNGVPIEDDYDEQYDFKDALRSAGNFRVKNKGKSASSKSYWKRKMMRSTNRELDPEVRQNLSLANEAFVRNDFQVALNLYLEVIKKDPKNFNAYKTLGEIYKQQGSLNECCNYWLLAANIHPWDSQFWASVAELSNELGHIDQAIYCYTRAISSDTQKSARYIIQRAILYREKKQFGRALEGFQRVLQLYPSDSTIVKNLASVYVEQKRLNDAINLYMRILDNNINPTSLNQQKYPKFGWAELNILLELYIQQHSWIVGIKVIKIVARWLQNRGLERWWDENDDDSEFDRKRRFQVIDKLSDEHLKEEARGKYFELPIDIRYKIGHLRLGLNQKEEAILHFEFLLDDVDDIADLYFDAGKVLEEHGYHEEALHYLTRAASSDDLSESSELINLLGKCFLEVGDYLQAQQAYQTLLYNEPDNLDHKIALAEASHHLGDAEGARKLLLEVASERENATPHDDEEELEDEKDGNLSLIKNQKLIRSAKSNKLSDQEKLENENNAKRKVLDKFRRMGRLEESVNNGEKVAIKTWMQLASQLIEMFMNVRSFFPRDKNRTFKGIVLYRRKKQMGIDEKLARVYNLYEGIVNDDNVSRQFLSSKTEYRGLKYDDWFEIFVQYAILLSKYENNTEHANEIIEVAMSVSIFVQDKKKEALLRMVKLIFGIQKQEAGTTITTYVRYFLINNQFSPFIYKFFICCFARGIKSWETFANYNHQKFFLRQLKAYDSILSDKKITGMARITADLRNSEFTKEHPDLLYVYANLLGGSRSYVSSVVYLNRAYKEYDQDPMICLVLGLAHVHRSMQRLSTNRHIQLLQGIAYILEYKELRERNATDFELQEIEYNFGRLFHMLGLTTLATQHYDKVLEYHDRVQSLDQNYDLLMEAAYNLTLIYNISGNSELASEITEKYLTI